MSFRPRMISPVSQSSLSMDGMNQERIKQGQRMKQTAQARRNGQLQSSLVFFLQPEDNSDFSVCFVLLVFLVYMAVEIGNF